MIPALFVARIAGEGERMKTYRKGILSTALWILLTVTCHAQTGWTIIDLGVLPGGDVVNDISIANGINENGEVAAQSTTPGSFSVDFQASLWSAGSGMQDLGPGSALGINNSGQVVGSTNNGAFVWSAGSGMQVLGSGYAQGINDSGQIVGASAPDVGTNGARAFLWSAGSGMQDLGTLPGDNQSQANGINDSGQVVGLSLNFIPLSNSNPIYHAFLWSSGSGMRVLGTVPGLPMGKTRAMTRTSPIPARSATRSIPSPATNTRSRPITSVRASTRCASSATTTVSRPDGKQFVFTQSGTVFAPSWVAPADVMDRLTQTANGIWIYTTAPNDEVETYDASGRLVSIANRAGVAHTMSYDSSGRLAAVTHSLPQSLSGKTLRFVYDASGRIASMVDPAGNVLIEPAGHAFSYAYDAAGNLSSVAYPGDTTNPVRTYVYNEPANTSGANLSNHLTGIIDENSNRFSTYKYAVDGRVISTEHAGGVSTYSVVYDSETSTVTDPLSTARIFGFQTLFDVPKHTGVDQPCDRCGLASSISYDTNGYLSGATNFNGVAFTYVHDARGLETSRIDASSTPQARTITTQWHPAFRLPTLITEPGRTTSFTYDDSGIHPSGNLLNKTITDTALSRSRSWTYTYNANGSVLTMDGPRTDVADITTYTYYANDDDFGKRGNVATIANALGQTTQVTSYNAHGQPLTIVDPNGLGTTLAYDARLRLTSRSVGGELTSYGYDGVGQLTLVTLPDGSFLSYSYDAAHRLTGMNDNLGNKIAYTLDAMGNRTQEQVFDPANSLARTRSRVYSNLNRLAQEIGAQSQTTQYGYDNQGNLTSITDPLNHATSNAYDALNRLIRVTDPNLGQTQYAYNGIDQLVGVTDPRNLATTYNYDALANLNSQQSPDTGATANTYDAAGNRLTQTDAKGQVTTYTYDALNRVTSITFHDGSKQSYGYDQGANGIGRLSSITETDPQNQVTSLLAYAYDQKGRTISETRTVNGVAYALAYSYDAAGRLSGLTYPSGRTIAYTLDALGRISQVSTTPQGGAAQIVASSIAYQPFGGVKSYTLGNGQSYSRSYDLDGRIASYNLGSQFFALGYDAASRISFISDTGNAANANTYSYDNLDRLIGAGLPNLPFAYGYDAVGHRSSKTVGSSTDTYA